MGQTSTLRIGRTTAGTSQRPVSGGGTRVCATAVDGAHARCAQDTRGQVSAVAVSITGSQSTGQFSELAT